MVGCLGGGREVRHWRRAWRRAVARASNDTYCWRTIWEEQRNKTEQEQEHCDLPVHGALTAAAPVLFLLFLYDSSSGTFVVTPLAPRRGEGFLPSEQHEQSFFRKMLPLSVVAPEQDDDTYQFVTRRMFST